MMVFYWDKSSFEFKESKSAVLLKTRIQKWDVLELSELFLTIMSKEKKMNYFIHYLAISRVWETYFQKST